MNYNFGPQRLNHEQACIALWLVQEAGLTQGKAATLLDAHARQISRVVRRESHPNAVPKRPGRAWTRIWDYIRKHHPKSKRRK